MKKNIMILFLVSILVLSTLSGCGNNNSNSSSTATIAPTSPTIEEKKEIDISLFPELKTSYENVQVYRDEVKNRLSSLGDDKSFIKEEEWEVISTSEWLGTINEHNHYFTFFSKKYDSTIKYYYPVVFKDGNQLILWYTSESGTLIFEKIKGDGLIEGRNYGGELHYDVSNQNSQIISTNFESTITYSQENGEVKVYEFGNIVDTFTGIPQEAIYVGFSYFEGYIFRKGTDVYSLRAVDSKNADGSVVCIAHNVKYVIDADYSYTSDSWCQPVFHMADGSIKVYLGMDAEVAAPDDPIRLFDVKFEGGYKK